MKPKTLEERYQDFHILSASEQVEFAKEKPHEVCSIIWYLEGWIEGYEQSQKNDKR